MYNQMYLETNNNFNIIEENKNIINNDKNKKEESKKKETKKEKQEDSNINDPSGTYMILKYTPNLKKIKDNKMKILGKKFVENNNDKCTLIVNGKELPLSEFYTLKKMI